MFKKRENSKTGGVTTQIVLSVIVIALGALLLFVQQAQVITLCYVFCCAMIAAGGIAIILFFLSGAHKRIEGYDFALGVMLLILGICGLIRVEELAEGFEFYMGLIALILGVIVLQGTVQMRVLQNKLWYIDLVLTALTLIGAVIVLANVKPVLNAVKGFTYWVLLIAGIASLVSLLLTTIGVKVDSRKAAREELEMQQEQEPYV